MHVERGLRLVGWSLAAALAAAAPVPARGAACEGACPPPALVAAEPALWLSVHLAWDDPHAARAWELERRPVGASAWSPLARVPGNGPRHADDRGPAGAGLAPGHYEYRVRGLHAAAGGERWSEWSAPRSAMLRAACAEAGGELYGLPRIAAGDRDGDGRYSGSDLAAALRECAARGGCTLEVLPVVYEDVAIRLAPKDTEACREARGACLDAAFPKGLAIEGHGSASVLRSPLWGPAARPEPVLELRRSDVRFQLRHLVLDGRKREQSAAGPSETGDHLGLAVETGDAAHEARGPAGCVHGLAVRDFLHGGLRLTHVRGWVAEDDALEDLGCDAGLTPCPRLPQAGTGSRARATGAAIGLAVTGNSDGVILRRNRVTRATGAGLALAHGGDGTVPGVGRPRVLENALAETGGAGLWLAGVSEGLLEGNRITGAGALTPHAAAARPLDAAAIACTGVVEQTELLRNELRDSAGSALRWECRGSANVVAQTRIAGSCRGDRSRAGSAAPSPTSASTPDLSLAEATSGTLALVDTEIADSGCAAPLVAEMPKPGFELLIRGGRYAAGPRATGPTRFARLDVILEGGTAFLGRGLAFGPLARAVVASGVTIEGATTPWQVDRSAQALLCPVHPDECKRLCAHPTPPRWCEAQE
jgi:hypothetical protein